VGNRVARRASVVFIAALLLAPVYPGVAARAEAEAGRSSSDIRPVTRFLDLDKRETKRFWTNKRMRAAEPVERVLEPGEVADWGPGVAGDEGVPRLVPGSDSSSTSSSPDRRPLRMVEASEQHRSGAFVPPGDPIPYTSGEITDTSVFPNVTHGKLFFVVPGGGTFVCSGTVVGAESQNVVWTAGHCVTEGDGGGFFTDFLFVPGYKDGSAPQGQWVGEHATTPSQWKNNGDFRYDVAALTMAPNGGQEIEEVVGSRGILFNQAADQSYRAIGHPQSPPFDGEKMRFCDSELGYLDPFVGDPAPMAIGCDMTPGSSGGGWIVEDPESGEGFVHSVNSYGYEDPEGEMFVDTMFGPQLGNVALAAYEAAGGEGPPPDTTPPKLTKVSDGPDPFWPLGKKKRKTTIKFTLNEKADVGFTIKSKGGATVAKVATSRLQPMGYKVLWDGRHMKSNKVVKAGLYTYKIAAKDVAGNSASKSGKVRVKR
jgi:V8-like Glu-specific endopeptidase